jgi:hypothetical protein
MNLAELYEIIFEAKAVPFGSQTRLAKIIGAGQCFPTSSQASLWSSAEKMALSRICYSAPLLLTRRGFNQDFQPNQQELQGSLIFWKKPSEVGFCADNHYLQFRVEEISVVLLEDTCANVLLNFGDDAKKGAISLFESGNSDSDSSEDGSCYGDDQLSPESHKRRRKRFADDQLSPEPPKRRRKGIADFIDWRRNELTMSVTAVHGKNRDILQLRHPSQAAEFCTYYKSLNNLSIILRDADSGKLINASVRAKVTFRSELK